MKFGLRISKALLLGAVTLLLTLLTVGRAQALPNEPDLKIGACPPNPTLRVSIPAGSSTGTLSAETYVTASGAPNVTWSVLASPAPTCTLVPGTSDTYTCAGLTVKVPLGNQPTATEKIVVSAGTATTTAQSLTVKVENTAAGGTIGSCTATLTFVATADPTAWGDPHLTTVDGTKYDFQSDGEFTALRDDKLEIQTRQTAVPTATVPITNPYTGITHCVAIYTAVAAKLGSTKVTLQPRRGTEPDPKSMELRVNKEVVTLGDTPLVLRSEGSGGTVDGTLTRHADGVIEMTDARGTQVVVTPQYWSSQKVWYLNLAVYGASASLGTLGRLADRSWLPALPDGSSLGPKPDSEAARYQVLYEKFADAWRVTGMTSLFDYAPGTTTADFTRDEWPRNHPASCAIQGQTSVQATTEPAAQQACAGVTNVKHRVDCVFDVMITGNTEFAKSYEIAERFKPRGTGWYTPPPTKETPLCPSPCPSPCPACGSGGGDGNSCPWCCPILIAIGILQLLLLAYLVIRSRSKP